MLCMNLDDYLCVQVSRSIDSLIGLVVCKTESSVVKEIAKLKQVDDIPKLAHITIVGVRDGQKEVNNVSTC